MRVLLLADTHVPKRDRADVVVHAGDWVDVGLLDALDARAARLIGVCGNNDGAALRARLPDVARATIAGVRVAVVHETGQARGREARCQEAYGAEADLLVFGHSHIPWDTTTDSGLRLINPGSPTDRRRQPVATYAIVEMTAGRITDAQLVPVAR
jgi:putative phosphoesterase